MNAHHGTKDSATSVGDPGHRAYTFEGEVALSADILNYYTATPLAVIFGVEPWNFPYYERARFMAPNLMAGNRRHGEACLQRAALRDRIRRVIRGSRGAPGRRVYACALFCAQPPFRGRSALTRIFPLSEKAPAPLAARFR